MSAEEVPNRADAVGAFESEEVGGGEAAISVSKENYADRKVSFTERSEYDTEIETISHTKEEGGEHTKEEGGEHTKEERGEHTKEKRGDEGSRTEEEIEEQKEESLLGSHENVHEDNSGSLVKCVSNSYDVEAQVENESQQISPSESQNNAGFLPWEEDIQMLSAFSDKKEELVSSHAEYMRLHPELRALLADFVQALFIQKPEDVFQFAQDFFRPYHPQAVHNPPFPSTAHS